jgi:predicted secreted hydrolase
MRATAPRLFALGLAVLLAGCVPSVYDEPYPVRAIELPRDDAAHAAPIEWWYWVGHLEDVNGRRYGFQLTFFEAHPPPGVPLVAGIPAHWLLEKGLVAHAAVSDLSEGRHAMAQRFDAYYDAAASHQDLDVFVGDWRAVRAGDGVSHALDFTVGGVAFDLELTPLKPAVLHGDPPGIHSMGPGGVSHYISYTRMDVSGTVRGPCRLRLLPRACPAVEVEGIGWHDHQWGDFVIDAFGGWDWFALQLDDGEEVMLYLIRDETGTVVNASGSVVTADGSTLALTDADFEVVPMGTNWTSERTGAVYPAEWRVAVPLHDLEALVVPLLDDQEMDTRATTRIVYWEGAVQVLGSRPGTGYVELTNYDRLAGPGPGQGP